MELYKAPNNTWIKVVSDNQTPIASPDINVDESIWFGHIDGMYSYCRNKKGEVVHLVAWANVYVDPEMINEPAPKESNEN